MATPDVNVCSIPSIEDHFYGTLNEGVSFVVRVSWLYTRVVGCFICVWKKGNMIMDFRCDYLIHTRVLYYSVIRSIAGCP